MAANDSVTDSETDGANTFGIEQHEQIVPNQRTAVNEDETTPKVPCRSPIVHNRKSKCSCLCMITVLGIMMVVLGCTSLPLINVFVDYELEKQLVLKENSTNDFNSQWIHPTVPVYMQIYMFNVTNPDKVMLGAKPNLTQHGPYTYKETRQKYDIVFNKNGTVTYKQMKVYNFIRELSIGKDTDVYVTLNFPFVIIIDIIDWLPLYMRLPLLALLKGLPLFREYEVKDIVWGYRDPLLVMAKLLWPKQFYTDIAGILAGKNNTYDGVYTIHTGEKGLSKLGIIDKFNGTSVMSYWTNKQANMVNGSDGTIMPPHVTKDRVIEVFASEVCRSLSGVYEQSITNSHGISLYKFVGSQNCFANATNNPVNAGFCTPAGNCLDTGVLNVSTCIMLDGLHLPVVVSFPHFLMSAPQYRDAIIGLDRNTEQYKTVFYVEPTTGILFEAYKRMQINLYLSRPKHVEQTKHLNVQIFPVLWGNESASMPASYQSQLKHQLVTPLYVAHIIQIMLIAAGGTLCLLSLFVLFKRKCASRRRKLSTIPTERSPLIQGT